MKYCFYRMKHDSGFAPNPYYGYCTLAACTPNHMRAKLFPGDVIVGVEGEYLIQHRKETRGNDTFPGRCLVFYMKISEVTDLDSYYRDQRFQKKIPQPDSRSYPKQVGDNVYWREGNSFRTVPGNKHDDPGAFAKDTKGDIVYIAKDFCYFGDLEIPFPGKLEKYIPNPRGIKYSRSPIPELDEYVIKESRKAGRKGRLGNTISKDNRTACNN